jgi:hypothetical protein
VLGGSKMQFLGYIEVATEPAPPPNSGKADTLDAAKAAFKGRYQEVKGRM